ncbi:MAG: ABC transporter permease [Oscillospiraceae bacterium]
MKRSNSKHLSWQLAMRYLQKHWKPFAAIALVMGLFASSLFSVQLLRGCVQHTLLEMRLDTYGHFSGAALWADPNTVTAEKLEKGHGGLAQVYGEFLIQEQNTQVSYGTLDATAARALGLQFKDGGLPQHAGEIALPYSVYVQLKQFVNIGESITVPIADAQNNAASSVYTLCGIFYDGYHLWEQAYSQLDNITLPAAIVYPTGETPTLAHIIFDDHYIGKIDTTPDASYWGNGKYYVNWRSVYRTESDEEEENNRIVLLTTFATILLSVLAFFGIRNAARMMLHEQQKNLQLLRCIGMTPKQVIQILTIQGLWLAFAAMIIGGAAGTGILALAVAVYRQMGNAMQFAFPLGTAAIAAALCFAVIFLSYRLQVRRMLRTAERNIEETPSTHSKKTALPKYAHLWQLYLGSIGKHKRKANRSAGVMLALLIGIMAFGRYAVNLYIADYFNSGWRTKETIGLEYCYRELGGSTIMKELNRETNRKLGLSADQLSEIESDPSLQVELSMTGTYATAFLQHTEESPAYQQTIAPEYSVLQFYESFDIDGKAVFADQGIPSDIDLLEYPIAGIPAHQLASFSADLTEGTFSEQAFADGLQAAVLGSEFAIGDRVTVWILEHSEDVRKPRATCIEVEIAAKYNADEETSRLAKLLQGRFGSECLLLPDQIMTKADSQLRYSYVWIKRLSDPTNETENARLEKKLLNIYAQCETGAFAFKNYATLSEQQHQLTAAYQAPYIFLGGLLLMLILLSLLFSTVTRSKIAYKQYAIMCTVGMTPAQLCLLMLLEHILFAVQYLLYGILLGWILISGVSFFTKTSLHIPLMLQCLLQISGLLAICWLFVAVMSALLSVHQMRHGSMVGGMHNDMMWTGKG